MGKLVTFWSPYVGQAKVTSTLCAVLGALGMQYPELEVAICHTKAEYKELEKRLDYGFCLENKKELYEKAGVSALTLNYMQAVLTSEKIRRCSIPLFMKSLHLFPGAGKKGIQEEVIFRILTEHLVKEFAVVFLDLENGKNDTSYRFMEAADAVIVVLPQHPVYWERFFQEETRLIEENKFYIIIGDYLNNSRYNVNYFRKLKEYRAKEKLIGGIPICAGYRDAMIEGKTLEFFFRNQMAEKKEENYEFIAQTKKAADYIKKSILLF